MTPDEIRAWVDERAPRATPEGGINSRHVAMEITLREKHGHPHYIWRLDGPGNFLPRQVDPLVVSFVAMENLTAPTHSMDDDYPDGLLAVFGAWFSTALMAWREYAE